MMKAPQVVTVKALIAVAVRAAQRAIELERAAGMLKLSTESPLERLSAKLLRPPLGLLLIFLPEPETSMDSFSTLNVVYN